MRERRAPTPRFSMAPGNYDATNEAQFRREVERSIQDAIAAVPQTPEVHITASRSSSSATLSLTALDAGRRIVTLEFRKREGSGSSTGWVSTWDTSTGTIGTDYQLVREEAVSIPAGLDSSAEWRMTYRDQDGAIRTKGGPIPLANLGSVSKTLRIPFSQLVPAIESGSWFYDYLLGYLKPNTAAATQRFVGSIVLPRGVTLDSISAMMYRETSSDIAKTTLSKNDDSTSSDIALLQHSTTAAWQTVTASSLGVVIGAETYWVTVELQGVAAGNRAGIRWVDLVYTVPDYSLTY